MAFVFDPIKGGRGGIGPFQTPWRYGAHWTVGKWC